MLVNGEEKVFYPCMFIYKGSVNSFSIIRLERPRECFTLTHKQKDLVIYDQNMIRIVH